MIKPLLALAAALSASAAFADTLVSNVNGMQVGPDGKLQHFKLRDLTQHQPAERGQAEERTS